MKALASQGVRFTQAYVPSPLCTPSRSAFASGREYDRSKVPSNSYDYPLSVPTFYSLLRDAGYHTITVGKDDLTKSTQLGYKIHYKGCSKCRDGDGLYHQAELGFSDGLRYSGKEDVVQKPYPHEMYGYFLQNQTVKTECGKVTNAWQAHRDCFGKKEMGPMCDELTYNSTFYEDDWTASNAITLLRRRPPNKPFFIHVSFPGPHDPFVVTASMRAAASDGRVWPEGVDNPGHETPGGACKNTGEPSSTRSRCNYAAEVENLDRLFKVVLDEVEAQGELERTLVVVTSDHGEMLGDHGDIQKSKPWQGSVSVPLVVLGPGVPKGRVVDAPVATLDLVALFLETAGAAPAEHMTVVSMRGFLDPTQTVPYRPFISSGLSNFRLVVKDVGGTSFKYICCKGQCPNPPSTAPKVSKSGWMEMLIDVRADPFDMHDLSKTMPEVVETLRPLLPTSGYSGDFAKGCATIRHEAISTTTPEPVTVPVQLIGGFEESCGVVLSKDGGVLRVAAVSGDGRVSAFGVERGWILQEVASSRVASALELQRVVGSFSLGDDFSVTFAPPAQPNAIVV